MRLCLRLRGRTVRLSTRILAAALIPGVCAAAITVSVAAAANPMRGHADRGLAALAPLPATSGPINCSQLSQLAFHYAPDPDTTALRGFEITIQAGAPLSFGAADIVDAGGLAGVGDPFYFDVVDNEDGTFTVVGAILGTTLGLLASADLFSVDFHGAATGAGLVEIAHYKLRGLDNVDIFATLATATIAVDCTPPGAASALQATRGHAEVLLTWSDPGDGDLAGLEIYRGVWHDGAYASAYPEYDDLPGSTLPTRPASRAAALASPEWELAGTAGPGEESFTDAWAPRGIYYYELFARDAAFNFGPPMAANAGPVFNYWLGDVFDSGSGDGFYDGFVDLGDITVMGAAFGLCEGAGAYDNEVDIGPTDNGGVEGIPSTDSCIDFEDLILFAINYGTVAPLAAPPAGSAPVQLSWYRIDETTWGCGLLAPNDQLKGLRLQVELPAGTPVQIGAGPALARQSPYFLANIDAHGIDVSLAILGAGRAFAGDGECLRVTLPPGCTPGELAVTARSLANAPLATALSDEVIPDLPAAYRVAQNHPNPFNPKTRIAFDLPAAQAARVSIFGPDGRLLRLLLEAPLAAGRHAVVWDGRDDTGGQVASGVYFYRVQAGPLDETRKMLLLK